MYQRNKMELNINASAIHVCMAIVLSEQLILHACEVSQFFWCLYGSAQRCITFRCKRSTSDFFGAY